MCVCVCVCVCVVLPGPVVIGDILTAGPSPAIVLALMEALIC